MQQFWVIKAGVKVRGEGRDRRGDKSNFATPCVLSLKSIFKPICYIFQENTRAAGH